MVWKFNTLCMREMNPHKIKASLIAALPEIANFCGHLNKFMTAIARTPGKSKEIPWYSCEDYRSHSIGISLSLLPHVIPLISDMKYYWNLSRCALAKWYRSEEKWVLPRKYLRYFRKTNTILFTMISAIEQPKLYFSSAAISIITKFSLFGYSSAGLHC